MPFLEIATKLPDGKTHVMQFDEASAKKALAEMETWGDDCGKDARELRAALQNRFKEATLQNQLLTKLEALVVLGLPVRTRVDGLRRLATQPPIGTRILEKAIAVLQEPNPKRRYWPLMDLLMHERAIAEQCFPDAEPTVPEHMREAPEWLKESPITEAKPKENA